jgi:6-phosphogluconolactonase
LVSGPRNFAIDPTGNFLLVAHHTNDIVIFKRDQSTGAITDTGKESIYTARVFSVY